MQPISDSSKKAILEVRNLHLVFRTDVHRSVHLRDLFVAVSKDPFGTLFRPQDRNHILQDVSFTIYKNDRVGILGVNGVGKTSLCRCIAGLYKPTRGSVQLHGKVRAILDTAVGIYPELTGRENAYLLAHFLYPEQYDNYTEIVEEALEFSELKNFLDTPFRTYSNGMQARLCLSLISCLPTDLLILDEVFEGADQFFREKISTRVLSMIEKSGAVLFVSHSREQVERVCNRLLLLDHGKIIFDGKVDEGIAIYEKNRKSFGD